ncbi:MAG: hypothetical protein K8F60_08650 [Melioribacteraceae bacterium]|jgi:hypothetical protein|nr:hypothetical protein [Ignavibacteriota bacterium]MBZ0182512.1 hypothetical protein [Melioribacteraceae bacterium]
MKKIILILFAAISLIGQTTNDLRPNAIYKNFKPFETPRTTGRPGTVFRIDTNYVKYYVEDVRAIKSFESNEGNVKGRMYFKKSELLSLLNLDFSTDELIPVEVELKNVVREYNEQTTLDRVFWDDDKAEEVIQDKFSRYFVIREAVLCEEAVFKFSNASLQELITGKYQLSEVKLKGDQVDEFPFYITVKFDEPKRLFYLEQEFWLDPYEAKPNFDD